MIAPLCQGQNDGHRAPVTCWGHTLGSHKASDPRLHHPDNWECHKSRFHVVSSPRIAAISLMNSCFKRSLSPCRELLPRCSSECPHGVDSRVSSLTRVSAHLMTKGALFPLLASVFPRLRSLSHPPLPQTQVCGAPVLYKDIWGPLVFLGRGRKQLKD